MSDIRLMTVTDIRLVTGDDSDYSIRLMTMTDIKLMMSDDND